MDMILYLRFYLVHVSPDAKVVVSGSHDRAIRVWDVKTGKAAGFLGDKSDVRLTRFVGSAGCLALLPDGKTLALGDSNAIRFVDLTTGQDRPQSGGHSQPVAFLAYSPDANFLLTRSGDHTMRLWNAATGCRDRGSRSPTGNSASRSRARAESREGPNPLRQNDPARSLSVKKTTSS